MTTPESDLVSITEILQSIQSPVTITYEPSSSLPWKVEMEPGAFMARATRLGEALIRCSTTWRAFQEQTHAR